MIEKLDEASGLGGYGDIGDSFNNLLHKINELIEAVNKLEKGPMVTPCPKCGQTFYPHYCI